jgi:hypothetical protein
MSSQPPLPPPQAVPPKRFNLFAMFRSAAFRDFAFAAILIVVELVLALRYGADTYRTALAEHLAEWQLAAPTLWIYFLAGLDVTLIDGVFMLMLTVAKYAGSGAKASKLRPFAAGGAILMFIVMLSIAVETMPVIAGARWAGAMLLSYIVSDIVIDWMHRIGAWWKARPQVQNRPLSERAFDAYNGLGYWLMMIVVSPVVWPLVGLYRVVMSYIAYFERQFPQYARNPKSSSMPQSGQNQGDPVSSKPPTKLERANAAKAAKRDRRIELGRVILQDRPTLTGPEFHEALSTAYKSEFGQRAKVGKSTALADRKEILASLEPAPSENGHGAAVPNP